MKSSAMDSDAKINITQTESPRKKRVVLDRTVSMTLESIPMKAKFRSASLRERWRNHWRDLNSLDEEAPDANVIDSGSPPTEDAPYFESFEDFHEEELRVKICKESIRSNLMEFMRGAVGSVHVLEDIENGRISGDDVHVVFANKSLVEKNVALLWSAFLKRSELLPGLLDCGADLNFCDEDGFSALHLSAFSCCLKCCKLLISRGANVNLLRSSYTPLHSAAFGNSYEAAKLLLSHGAKIEFWQNGLSRNVTGGTALHSAVKANSLECLQLLVKECADVNSTEPSGCSALHMAADNGNVQCLRLLLEYGSADPNVQTRSKKATPLHMACDGGYGECVALLLSKGADPSMRNYRGQTPLHLAARSQSLECAEALLKCIKCDPNAEDDDQRTPLHTAVGKDLRAFDMVELLVASKADVNHPDKYGYTPLHIAALNELSQCVETLIYHGADVTAKTKGGTSALNIIVRKTPASMAIIYDKFDTSISMNDPEGSQKEVELKLDFRTLLQRCENGEIYYIKSFVDEGQKEILQHPLCEAFLHLKWQKIRKYFFARLVFCFLFVFCLTTYVLTRVAGICYEKSVLNSTGNESCHNRSVMGDIIFKNQNIVNWEWYILVFFTLCEVLRKIYGFAGYARVKQYLEQPENALDWFIIISVCFLSVTQKPQIWIWQEHVGAFVVLFAWINLMFMIGQLPLLGSYIAMYTKVQMEFIKLLLAYSFLLIGFTISFSVVIPNSAFADPFKGIVKVLVLMTGEFEFNNLILENSEILHVTAFIIFVMFLLSVSVVLMNLLVGIAVHDIQGLQKTAGLSKLERQTRLIAHIELALFNGFLPRYFLKLFKWTALVSPSAYRVVLHVKPLNPREKRLPKHILKEAYEIAKARKKSRHTASSQVSIRTVSTRYKDTSSVSRSNKSHFPAPSSPELLANVQNIFAVVEANAQGASILADEVQQIKAATAQNKLMLQEILNLLNSKSSEC